MFVVAFMVYFPAELTVGIPAGRRWYLDLAEQTQNFIEGIISWRLSRKEDNILDTNIK